MEQNTSPAEAAVLQLFERLAENPDGPQPLDGAFLMLRADFDRLSPADRMTFMRGNGRIVDQRESTTTERPALGPRRAYRSEFDAMSPADKLAFVKQGGRLVD